MGKLNATSVSQETQIELESYGCRFLRINMFNLRPEQPGQTEVDVLDRLLTRAFAGQ